MYTSPFVWQAWEFCRALPDEKFTILQASAFHSSVENMAFLLIWAHVCAVARLSESFLWATLSVPTHARPIS